MGWADGPRSSTWRVWTERDGEDPTRDSVYVACRPIASQFKISLHPREWRVAFADPKELHRIALGPPPQNRAIQVLAPTPEAAPGVRRGVTIVIPWLAVQLPRDGKPEEADVYWLPPIAEDEVTMVTLVLTAPHVVIEGEALIASAALRDGSTVWLSIVTRSALPDEIRRWAEEQARFASEPRVVEAARTGAHISGVFGGNMPDGSPWLLDLPIPVPTRTDP